MVVRTVEKVIRGSRAKVSLLHRRYKRKQSVDQTVIHYDLTLSPAHQTIGPAPPDLNPTSGLFLPN